jgi:hypothetical protein
MKYWGLLAGKLAAAAIFLRGVWMAVERLMPPPQRLMRDHNPAPLHDLGWASVLGLFFLLCCGALYLIILDQRYRCRVCARRLRMPVTTGSWHKMLQFGLPRTEYICLYGHGTLNVPELQFTGKNPPDWKGNEDMWKELFPLEETKR